MEGMKYFYPLLTTVVLILLLNFLPAQNHPYMQNAAFPPPVPPVFRPADTSTRPVTRSGNNYKIPFDTIRINPRMGTKGFDVVICVDGVINSAQIAIADNY